ncbi:MAG: CHAP domain-containing protein [Ramlibacter sp.]|nr:CHAP domain-containing protein [Cryobacterium sp.]
MPHSGVPGAPDPSENPVPLPTRRELRAQREAAEAQADPTVVATVALSVPGPVPVAVSTDAVSTVAVSIPVAVPVAVPAAGSRMSVAPAGMDVAAIVSPPRLRQPKAVPPAATAPRRPVRALHRRSPLKIAVTLLAIPGLFLTAGLPAYAFSPGTGEGSSIASTQAGAARDAQGVTVDASAAAVTVSRDSFTATSTEELADRAADALSAKKAADSARSASANFAVYGVRAEGDDYPWFDRATDAQGGGLSPLGYYYRECVDFVAWRLNRDAGSTSSPYTWTWSNLTPGGGNASSWSSAWSNHGWATSKTPVVGAVAWFTYNHVAYVQSINGDGTVVLEEYNWNGSHAYHTRTVPASEVPLFLYPPA